MMTSLGQTLAAFISAGLGAVLAVSIGVSHKQLCALISFAAGTLFSATFFHIVPEAWEYGISFAEITLALASGYAVFFLISRYVSHMCPACSASHFEHKHAGATFKNFFFLMAVALTIHSMMDGMAIAFIPQVAGDGDPSIFFTVAIHKLPEGLALCALLLKAGNEKNKALALTLLFEFTTILGWAVAYGLLRNNLSGGWINLMMVHIAGGFIYLSLHAMINEARDHGSKFTLTFFGIGALFMALVR